MRPSIKKKAKRGTRSRSAVVRKIGYDRTTAAGRKAIAEGRRAYKRGDFVTLDDLDMKTYLARSARRASVPKALKVLKRAGVGKPPMKGDERRKPR